MIIALTVGCLFAGCKSKMDLENVDGTAEVSLGLALPVGSIHARLGDFIGYSDQLYVENGIITWRDTFPDGKKYHDVELAKDTSVKEFPLKVYEELDKQDAIHSGVVVGHNTPITLAFDMELSLKGVNDVLGDERVDSAIIEEASFITNLTKKDFPLDWKYVDKIELDLGDQIRRPAGNTKVVYDKTKGDSGDFSQDIETSIDNFSLCLMKDLNMPAGDANILNSAKFRTYITLIIPEGVNIPVNTDSELDYTLKVSFIRYKALWGYFKPSKDMYCEVTEDVAKSWNSIGFLKDGNMPFSNPYIKVDIETKIAGRMRVDSAYVYSIGQKGEVTYAEFFETRVKVNRDIKLLGDFLDPHNSPIGATAKLYTEFDNTPNGGRIDALFGKLPDSIGYKFKVFFDRDLSPQVRLTPEDSIKINAVCVLPMQFHDSAYFHYNDTVHDVQLSQFSIDSLVQSINILDSVKTTDVMLILKAQNEMPFSFTLKMTCLDDEGKVIMDPEKPSKPLSLFQSDSVRIESAQYTKTGKDWHRATATETKLKVGLNKEKLNVLPKIKTFIYSASIDEYSLQEAFDNGFDDASLLAEEGFIVKIGLTSKLEAIMDFNEINANTNTK